jgi:c-di-GMP-binding flagellar brake protein YcgR
MPKAKISIDRRTNPRLSVKIPVKYQLVDDKKVLKGIEDWRQSERHGFTLDLSMGGMQLVVDQPLPVKTVLKFDIYIMDKSRVISVYAEVMWTNEKGTGLRFLMMKTAEEEALKTFLENIPYPAQ